MPTMPDSYYDNFSPTKQYEKLLYRDGYTLQGAELNEQQSATAHRLKNIADALFKDGDIIRDASIIIDKETGLVRASSGAVYLGGAVRGVPDAQFTIPVTGTVAVGVRLAEKVISELDDPSLYNPAIGSRGEGEPGAWRLQVAASWSWEGDNGSGEFYPVYTVDNGELRAKEAPPTLDSFTQGIARYDRDSTAGGSYIVTGLTVLAASADASGQVFTVSEGRARVNGYGVELPASRRLTYAAVPDTRTIDTEVHTADASSMTAGGQRLAVAHSPIHEILSIRITTRKTVTLTHGSYSGCSDTLPDTAVVSLVECRQGDTVYAAGTDYKKTGDKIDWSPSGAEPASGSTFSVTYDCMTSAEAQKADTDGFSVEGAVAGSSILISYRQALPRLDRLCLTQDGQFQWIQGVASELNARAPSVPSSLLPIATVFQEWSERWNEAATDGGLPRSASEAFSTQNVSEGPTRTGRAGAPHVENDGVRAVPFSEIEAINRRIDYVLNEVSRQRLEADVFTRESGARVGLFVDPLLNDDMRDQGFEQTAAIINGVLTLPVAAKVSGLSADVTVPTALPFTLRPLLSQPLRTGSMKVNPYMAFAVMPASVSLSPAVDYWTDTQSRWASPVTERFYQTRTSGWGNTLASSSTSSSSTSWTSQVGSERRTLENLRPITVAFTVDGFGPGEELRSVTFDGIPVTVNPA